jgi:tight adherence protein B
MALLGVAVAALFLALGGDEHAPGRRWLARYLESLDVRLRFVRSRFAAQTVALGQLAAVVTLSFGAVVFGLGWLLMGFAPASATPWLWLERRRAARVAELDAQLDQWLLVLSNALKASASLGDALESSIGLVRAPLSEEVDLVLKRYRLGTPLDRALADMAARVGSRSISAAVLMLRVARNAGGDLPSTLDRSAAALREIARLEGVVRSKTAEAKAQAAVISLIPAPFVFLIHWLSPAYLRPLTATLSGQLIIAGALAMWAIAIVLAAKIAAVEV